MPMEDPGWPAGSVAARRILGRLKFPW